MKLDISPTSCGDEYCNCFTGMFWESPCPECGFMGQLQGFNQYGLEMDYYDVDPEPIIARCDRCGATWRCEAPTGKLYDADEWEWERVESSTETGAS